MFWSPTYYERNSEPGKWATGIRVVKILVQLGVIVWIKAVLPGEGDSPRVFLTFPILVYKPCIHLRSWTVSQLCHHLYECLVSMTLSGQNPLTSVLVQVLLRVLHITSASICTRKLSRERRIGSIVSVSTHESYLYSDVRYRLPACSCGQRFIARSHLMNHINAHPHNSGHRG